MGAWLSAITQGAGQAGSDFSRGVDQNVNVALARLHEQLQTASLQQQIRESQQRVAIEQQTLNRPQTTFHPTPQGGTVAVQVSPTGAIGAPQQVVPDIPPPTQEQLNQLIGTLPPERQASARQLATILPPHDMYAWLQKESLAKIAAPKKVDIQSVKDVPYAITDEAGHTWDVNDPTLPAPLKQQLDTYRTASKTAADQAAAIEARKNGEMLGRAIAVANATGNIREQVQAYNSLFKTAQRGVSGHSFLRSVRDQVQAAAKTPSQAGTTSGDMQIVEGFMQLMFGVDPKALRGSPQMMQVLLKQGGWDDRFTAALNTAYSGGRLSQNVRQQILDSSERQIRTWDQAVTQAGALADDPHTQQLVNRYQNLVASDSKNSGTGYDLSGLGAKKVTGKAGK